MSTVVVACDKFRGSLTAREAGAAVAAGIIRCCEEIRVVNRPVADGGEGTVAAAVDAGYELRRVRAEGPTGVALGAELGTSGTRAVIESASACGMNVLPGGEPAPLRASSFGVGQLIIAALDAGTTDIVLGLGGSACTDGGAGVLQALGARVIDADGREVDRGGGALRHVARVDLSTLDPRLGGARVVLATDVTNPLLGPDGAATVFAPQKGADAAQVRALEAGLTRWADCVAAATGADRRDSAGAGAAGGIGFAGIAALGARARSGVEVVMELVGLDELLGAATLVVTGEGSLDEQTLAGKAPAGVAAAARRHGVPIVAVAGRSSLSEAQTSSIGLAQVYALLDLVDEPARAMRDAARLLETIGERIARDWLRPEPPPR